MQQTQWISEAADGVPDAAAAGAALSRRGFLHAGAVAAGVPALAVAGAALAQTQAVQAAAPGAAVPVRLTVNGTEHRLLLDPRVTLLDALREQLGLTGSKKGCDQGQCGACTVLADGERVLACLTLAVAAQERAVTTIEGLEENGRLHPMQQAFIDHDAFQCGYCTPGQIMSAVGLVNEGRTGSDAEIREYMSGNLCRCGAYGNIVAAIRQADAELKQSRIPEGGKDAAL